MLSFLFSLSLSFNILSFYGNLLLYLLRPGARLSKVPITFRARKAICETANRLFWKAGLLTCFKGNKKKNYREVLFVFEIQRELLHPKMARKVSGLFEKRAPGLGLLEAWLAL